MRASIAIYFLQSHKRCSHAFSYSGAVSLSSLCGVRIRWSAVAAAAAAAAADDDDDAVAC